MINAALSADLLATLATALGCGLLVGLDRERRKLRGPRRPLAGLRTFALTSISGAAAMLSGLPELVAVGALLVVGLAVVGYLRNRTDDPGVTTEVALLLTYLIGVLCAVSLPLAAGLWAWIGLHLLVEGLGRSLRDQFLSSLLLQWLGQTVQLLRNLAVIRSLERRPVDLALPGVCRGHRATAPDLATTLGTGSAAGGCLRLRHFGELIVGWLILALMGAVTFLYGVSTHAALLCLLAGLGLLWLDGRFAMPEWIEDFIGYLWLIIFPEAFINGMVISALVVFCPEWLETFNRTRYLQAPWKDDQ